MQGTIRQIENKDGVSTCSVSETSSLLAWSEQRKRYHFSGFLWQNPDTVRSKMQVSEFPRLFASSTTNQSLLERFSFTKWSVDNRQLAVIDIL